MELIRTKGIEAKDIFNATSATPIKDIKDQVIAVNGVFVKEKTEDDGKVTTVGYLRTEDGVIYATVSATINDQLEALAEMLDSGVGVCNIKVVGKTSNANREYFQLELV